MNKLAGCTDVLWTVLLLLNLAEYSVKAKTILVADEKTELDWWQTAVIYQIYPRSFKDNNGDGVGDLKGIEGKADHLKDIGVNCIWLSSIFKSPMADFGYDISDFNQIDSTFGTMDDFISLQKKLKSLGIKIILDFVPNHTSDEHEWFKKSEQKIDPYTDYYVWKSAKIHRSGFKELPNNWQSVFSNSAWAWSEERKQYYLHQFDTRQPDLNYRNPELVEDMKNYMRFWLDRGIDGYRLDSVSNLFEDSKFLDEPKKPEEIAEKEKNTHNQYYHPYTMDVPETYDMINQFRDVMDEYKRRDGKTRILIIEAHTSINNTMRYYGTDSGAYLPFNFGLITGLNDGSNASDFNDVVYAWLDNMPRGKWPNWVIGNHDQHRVATRMGPEMVDAMNMLNLLLPGTAFTYMGEEIGMEDTRIRWNQTVDPMGLNVGRDGYRELSRDPERSPYQWTADASAGFTAVQGDTWLPVNPDYWKLNLAAQKQHPRSHYAVYKRLTALRRTRTVQRGAFEGHVLSEWVYAFSRSLRGAETYLVVINVGSQYERVDLSVLSITKEQHLAVHTSSVNSQYSVRDTLNTTDFEMRPKSALVLVHEEYFTSSALPLSTASLVVITCSWAIRWLADGV